MSIYELPDGFEGMETAPKCAYGLCNVFLNNGHYGTSYPPFASCVIGWAPIVPPKKKRRFVVEGYEWRGTTLLYRVTDTTRCIDDNWCAGRILTRQHAEELASLYEKMHEPAYEGGGV